MIDVGGIFIGAAVSAILGYVTYSYRNTISYILTVISTKVAIEDNKMLPFSNQANGQRLTVERLDLRNYGFRRLRDIELHVPITNPLLSSEVVSTSSISKGVIKLESDDEYLRIHVPLLPRNEEIRFHFATTSGYQSEYREIKGTGGDYRVVEGRSHKVRRDLTSAIAPWAIIGAAIWLIPWLLTLLNPASDSPKRASTVLQQKHP